MKMKFGRFSAAVAKSQTPPRRAIVSSRVRTALVSVGVSRSDTLESITAVASGV
jgi:hypothetical protein